MPKITGGGIRYSHTRIVYWHDTSCIYFPVFINTFDVCCRWFISSSWKCFWYMVISDNFIRSEFCTLWIMIYGEPFQNSAMIMDIILSNCVRNTTADTTCIASNWIKTVLSSLPLNRELGEIDLCRRKTKLLQYLIYLIDTVCKIFGSTNSFFCL